MKNIGYNKYLDFTDAEVREMFAYYEPMVQYNAVKEWYDEETISSESL